MLSYGLGGCRCGWNGRGERRHALNRARSPQSLVEFFNRLNMQQTSSTPPDLHTVINSKTRTECSSQDVTTARTPFACGRVGRGPFCHLFPGLEVPNIDRSRQVSETGGKEELALRLVGEEVTWLGTKRVDRVRLGVEEDGSGGHDWGGGRTSERRKHKKEVTSKNGVQKK